MSGGASLLALLQLADSALPTGAYAFSHGLESAAQLGWVVDAAGLEAWLASMLRFAVAPTDAVAAACATRAATTEELVALDRRLLACKLPREARASACRVGRRLLALAPLVVGTVAPGPRPPLAPYAAAVDAGQSPGTAAVALGAILGALGHDAEQAALLTLHTTAQGTLSAALRLLRIDHRETTAILARLRPLMAALAVEHARWPAEAMGGGAPQIDLAAMLHEHAHVRLFAS